MNFGELLEEVSGARAVAAADIPFNMPAGAIAHPRFSPPAAAAVVAKSIFASSTGLSLALQTSMQEAAQGELANARGEQQQQQLQPRITQTTNNNNREEEYESRSGSDNMEGGSGDDLDADHPPRKKRYHRHTPQQIQELESYRYI